MKKLPIYKLEEKKNPSSEISKSTEYNCGVILAIICKPDGSRLLDYFFFF